jgi:two-component system, OmpR family, response regulator CpxR
VASEILVIDDDVELCELLTEYLGAEGFRVNAVHDGREGLAALASSEPALVVLDVMLPGLNGFDVLRRLRERSSVPVLMLTARGQDVDRIVGLEMGADDYLAKPFNPRELVARIRAIQRRLERSDGRAGGEVIVVGDVELRVASRTVRRAGEEIALTSAELTLLEVLLRAAGDVVSREDLSSRVLERRFSPYDRSIDVHVSNLRKKLGPSPSGGERIKTVRGHGYLYALEAP